MKEENQSVQEPVAIVGNDYSLHWAGRGPIAPIIERHSIRPGSLLYAAPDVSGLVAALEEIVAVDVVSDQTTTDYEMSQLKGLAVRKMKKIAGDALSAHRESQP